MNLFFAGLLCKSGLTIHYFGTDWEPLWVGRRSYQERKVCDNCSLLSANGEKSEEAIGAYRKALDIFPGFVRARYNLGISCINLKAYKVAAEHFLSALNFQASPSSGKPNSGARDLGKVMSDNIWSSLRLTLGLLDKRELNVFIEQRDLAELNRAFNVKE